MKRTTAGIYCILLLLMVSAVQVVGADTTSSSTTSDKESLYVKSVTIDPAVLYPYEEGTVTITVANDGNASVGVSNPDLLSTQVHVTKKDTWNTMTYIRSGSSITYEFVVTAEPPDGDYFALFTLETVNGAPIHYPITIKIDSEDLKVVVADQPDYYPVSSPQSVNLTIMNPREAEVKNIIVNGYGDGLEVSPSTKYVASIDSYNSTTIPFTVTAHKDSTLTFNVTYRAGDTDHTVTTSVPVKTGSDETSAEPVVNNIAVTSQGSYYDLTGDVTNAGVTDAKGLVVTVGSPAKGTGTYPEYAVGALATDDSGSFEVTFTAQDLSAVPLVISWKDSNGGSYSMTKTLDLSSSTGTPSASTTGSSSSSGNTMGGPGGMSGGPGGMSGGPGGSSSSLFGNSNGKGISAFYPLIAGAILLIVGIVVYKKRKWLAAKLKKQ